VRDEGGVRQPVRQPEGRPDPATVTAGHGRSRSRQVTASR
jgi:hypothetical protein